MRGRIGLRKATVVELLSVISLLWFTADRGLAQNDSGTRAPVPVIRNITIQRENVFSQKERHDGILGDTPGLRDNYYGSLLAWLVGRDGLDAAGWANRLHFKTTAPVIERDLLFKPGDKLDYSLLSETERNLRA